MYQALYRKYRPQTFDDVVGQLSTTQTLKNQLLTGKLSHAYLFTGSHGTGKTTCAKILAKAVNCQNPVDGNPCNCCPACRGIDSGNIMDVLEIDAASNNGVDNVRTLRDEAIYPPAEVKKRVYIIDEVHMLSTSAFNALLKIVEEPPEHLLFILATTELNKVPATILSRCQRYAFRRLIPEDITGRINFVAYQEGIEIDSEAADLLGRLADGALRDGLSLLDQCASATVGTLTVEAVYNALGLAGQQQTASLMSAIGEKDSPKALTIFSDLYSAGKDAGALLGELSTLARDMLITKTAPQAGLSLISSTCSAREVTALAPKFTAEELLRMISILQETTNGFKTSTNQRVDGELCLLRLCQPGLSLDARNLSSRISRVEEELTTKLSELERKIASGAIQVTAAEAPPAEILPWEEPAAEATPVEEEIPAPQSDPEADAFRAALMERVLPDLPAMYRGFFEGGVVPDMKGNDVLLRCESDLAKNYLNKPEVLEVVQKKAEFLLKKPVRVRFADAEGNVGQKDDKLKELAAFGSQFDNISIS